MGEKQKRVMEANTDAQAEINRHQKEFNDRYIKEEE